MSKLMEEYEKKQAVKCKTFTEEFSEFLNGAFERHDMRCVMRVLARYSGPAQKITEMFAGSIYQSDDTKQEYSRDT